MTVELSAAIVAASPAGPSVLAVRRRKGGPAGLPSGPLEAAHRTLEAGLRRWVEDQTRQQLGHVEQLYTFGDRDRAADGRALSIGYLALVREARPAGSVDAAWQGWYRHFPWEDRRDGRPPGLDALETRLAAWADSAADATERRLRRARLAATFGLDGDGWIEDRVLERYELLYEAGLVAEACRTEAAETLPWGEAMIADHRRILATAIGRLRGKIKYRPIVFELMPPSFTFLQLQQTVEGLAGIRLHKPNFRRLVEQQGLVEETGAMAAETGGRPARLLRFRPEVLQERPAPGLRLPRSRPPA
ncbi:hypothetical protein EDC65_4060 [Stella humosa]|uniref:NrtR DNA-binding winged helix domain-containing protein n=1 Tax=Stella humosa TaxID=94 RepID=A0A3N1KXV2_9PROT|nr:hypothetical protein [Stella humosa]ROP84704.1 hypothetical protein EDC65_4060 [Stella humosa]BBK34224.1 membrane protein [Stella humosa]